MKRIFHFISGLILLSACSETTEHQMPAGDAPVPVTVTQITPLPVREPLHVSGVFTTDDEVILSFKTGGIIRKIFVREGDAVKTGQLLAALDMTEITAQVTQATLAYEKAQRDFRRAGNLFRDSVITLEMFENANTGLDLAREQLTAARFNKDHSEIRAVQDGYILRKFVNEGQVVAPGTPVFQANGAGDGDWLLRVAVSDGQWVSIDMGDSARITFDAAPGLEIPGKVSARSEGVDPYSGTFTVDIKPVGPIRKPVASGMFGRASITPHKARMMWKIPYDALLDGNNNSGFVFITRDGKTSEKRKVTIEGLSRDYILSGSGLDSVNTLIISGNAYLRHGSNILIVKE